MRRSLIPFFVVVLAAACLAAPSTAHAQEPDDLEFQQVFEQGLEAINSGRHDEAVDLFKRCIELAPERPTAYYNIACALSLKGEKSDSIDWLEKALDKGFLEFEHMERDTDLDNIRNEARFKELVEKFKKGVIEGIVAPAHVPTGAAPKGGRGLLVMLHGAGGNAEDDLARWSAVADEHGLDLVVLQGDQRVPQGGFTYGNATETTVLERVRALMSEHGVNKDRVFIGGFSIGGFWAFQIAIRHPDLFAGVLSVNGFYDERGNEEFLASLAEKKNLKVFFVHGRDDERTLEPAREMRNQLADSGVEVVLRRIAGGHAITPAAVGQATHGIGWFLGKETGQSPKRIF